MDPLIPNPPWDFQSIFQIQSLQITVKKVGRFKVIKTFFFQLQNDLFYIGWASRQGAESLRDRGWPLVSVRTFRRKKRNRIRHPIRQHRIGEDRGSRADDRLAQQEGAQLLDEAGVQRLERKRSGKVRFETIHFIWKHFIWKHFCRTLTYSGDLGL